MTVASFLALVPSDALAIAMVAILGFALGIIVAIFFVMARSASHHSEVDPEDLLEEEEEDFESSHNVGAGDPPKELKEPWEQDPDWWRK